MPENTLAQPDQQTAEKRHPILDRCWASHISAAGGALAVLSANEIRKKRYGRASAYATGSAACDFLDGAEAKRFARRRPAEAALRRNRGAIEDQFWDKFRNILTGVSVMTIEKVPPKVKRAVGALVVKEVATLAVGAKTIIDHRKEHGEGWPAPLPSSPLGRESMWWIGGGLSGSILAAKLQDTSPELSAKMETTAASFCAIGVARGIQSIPEYLRANKEMSIMSPEEQMAYKPDFYTPHIGSYVMRGVQYVQNTIHDNLSYDVDPLEYMHLEAR